MLEGQTEDRLADFIDSNAHRVLIDYTKLDFPSLMVYLCQRRGTKKYIGDMFKVIPNWLIWINRIIQDYDKDGSGEISRLELQKWMMKTGRSLTEIQTNRLLLAIDFNNDGNIDYREFLLIVIRKIISANNYK